MPNTNSLWKFSFQFFPTISHEKCRDKLCFMKKVLLVLRRRPPEKRSWGINATLLETNYFHPTIFFKLIFKHWCSSISYWCLFILLNKAAYPDFFNDFESFSLFLLILVVAILTEKWKSELTKLKRMLLLKCSISEYYPNSFFAFEFISHITF